MSTALIAVIPPAIRRRWDALALEQLCEHAAVLAQENKALREEAARADEAAEFWHDEAVSLQLAECERIGGQPGITRAGNLVVVPAQQPAPRQPNDPGARTGQEVADQT